MKTMSNNMKTTDASCGYIELKIQIKEGFAMD